MFLKSEMETVGAASSTPACRVPLEDPVSSSTASRFRVDACAEVCDGGEDGSGAVV